MSWTGFDATPRQLSLPGLSRLRVDLSPEFGSQIVDHSGYSCFCLIIGDTAVICSDMRVSRELLSITRKNRQIVNCFVAKTFGRVQLCPLAHRQAAASKVQPLVGNYS